ncbi:hypothetical protein Q9L58_007171 [Maublancomyces gigas]|uniref:LITAF domain-containing protein n=1 Tax=Discina gigas TaxID=1032678 RepID=A0ABR3GDD8_9PEZI
MSDTKFQAGTPAFTANHPTASPDQHYYQGQTEAPIPPYQQGTPNYEVPQPVQLNNTHGSSQYLHATPLTALTRGPAPVDCPMCGRRALTATTFSTGNFTHLWAAVTCFTLCLGCIPYLISGLKDVQHTCGNCGALLAIWHRSGGGVDVVAHQMK